MRKTWWLLGTIAFGAICFSLLPSSQSVSLKIVESKPHRAYLTTIVTSYFPLGNRAKHSEQSYREWFSRFLRISSPVVVYTTNQTYGFLRELRADRPTLFKILDDVWKLPYGKFRDEYVAQHNMDPEKKIHSPELYVIWNSKSSLVSQVAKENPFGSEFFLWVDIGSFRDPRSGNIGAWPWDETIRKIMSFGHERVLVGEMFDHTQPPEYNLSQGPFAQNFVEGGFFGGTAQAVSWFSLLFYQWHEEYRKLNKFVGKDQAIMNALVLAYPARFLALESYKADSQQCGDLWFYFIPFLLAPIDMAYGACPRIALVPRDRKVR